MVIRKIILLLSVTAFIRLCATGQVVSAASQLPSFAVATIKPSKATGWRLQPTPSGYTSTGVSLQMLVEEAYGLYDDKLILGGPGWFALDKFGLEAKLDDADIASLKGLTYRNRADMLQALLADRFKLKVHYELKRFPVFNLVVRKDGPRMRLASLSTRGDTGIKVTCHVLQSQPGFTERRDCDVASLEGLLQAETGRPVIDKTGLSGHYDFELRWRSEQAPPTATGEESGPSIFKAVQEQLGLKLEPAMAPLKVLVIDNADHPSEN